MIAFLSMASFQMLSGETRAVETAASVTSAQPPSVLYRRPVLRPTVRQQVPATLGRYVAMQERAGYVVLPPPPTERPGALYIDGVDYGDPVGGGAVPLVRVAGFEDKPLSRTFRLGDFASRDSAAYARVSPALVAKLEKLRSRAGSLVVLSGYRHRTYNDREDVGGAETSRHIAGLAADVYSSTQTPLALAGLALQAFGCRVGLGLGATSLHLDVRGGLTSWTYEGAEMDSPAFEAWVRQQCGLAPIDSLAAGKVLLADEGASKDSTSAITAKEALSRFGTAMATTAQRGRDEQGIGAVVLDLRDGIPDAEGVAQRLRFVPGGSDAAARWKLKALIESSDPQRHFPYLVMLPSGSHAAGLASLAPGKP